VEERRAAAPVEPAWRPRAISIGLFIVTLICVFWVYGTNWMGGSPFSDPAIARGSARFALGLMTVMLAHEMGHYFVARRHGFALSLPYFLPVPFAFGTFGAIIRLKSLPRDRTGLLEMGAAGPLAGFLVAVVLIAVGLSGTVEHDVIEIVVPPVATAAAAATSPDAGLLSPLFHLLSPLLELLLRLLDLVLSSPPLAWLLPAPPPADTLPMLILGNPPVMDLLGLLIQGHAPGSYATLDPLAMAGWVGCLVTAINLVPIGQLDGGHVFNALFPRQALRVSRIGVGLALLAGVAWPGWAFWGVLLLVMRAWHSLPVPLYPRPSNRARGVALLTLATWGLCFMPRPLEVENVPYRQIHFVSPDGTTVPPPDLFGPAQPPAGDPAPDAGALAPVTP